MRLIRSLDLTGGFTLLALLTALAVHAESFPLLAPLGTPVPGYEAGVFEAGTPTLAFNPDDDNVELYDAFEDGKTLDDANLIVSALKAADENPTLGEALEQMVGLGTSDNLTFVANALPGLLDQDGPAERLVVGRPTAGSLEVPLAFDGVPPIPILFAAEASNHFLRNGRRLLTGATATWRADVTKTMPDLITRLGHGLTRRPSAELVKRLKRARFSQRAGRLIGLAEPLTSTPESLAVAKAAQTLYARDLTLAQMMTAILARQIGPNLDLLATLVAALEPADLEALALVSANLIDDSAPFLGPDGHTNELLFLAYGMKAAIVARTREEELSDGERLARAVRQILETNARIETFDADDARARIDTALAAQPARPGLRGRLQDFFLDLRK